MEQITITAKIQIVATETDKVLLDETMSVYRNACHPHAEVSRYGFLIFSPPFAAVISPFLVTLTQLLE
jgi:hypothetical protein